MRPDRSPSRSCTKGVREAPEPGLWGGQGKGGQRPTGWEQSRPADVTYALRRAPEDKDEPTMLTTLSRATALAAMIAAGMPAAAQTTTADPHHPETMPTQAMPPSGMMGQGQGAQAGQSTRMQPGMMGQSSMGRGMMGMPGPAPMKIFFAIADANADGGLSFDEVTAIHRRIFDRVDANKDGRATSEEIQTFMRE